LIFKLPSHFGGILKNLAHKKICPGGRGSICDKGTAIPNLRKARYNAWVESNGMKEPYVMIAFVHKWPVIHCTQKLLKEMGLSKKGLPPASPSAKGLGNWYANLNRISHDKYVLFTNELTLFSFVVFPVKKKELLDLENLFRLHFHFSLRDEGIPNLIQSLIFEDYRQIGYAATQNRSVLGSMNDIVGAFECFLEDETSVSPLVIRRINKELNRCIYKTIDYDQPIERLIKELTVRYPL
jgi:hypothetical protein